MMKNVEKNIFTDDHSSRKGRLRKLLAGFLAVSTAFTMLSGNVTTLLADELSTEYSLAGAGSGQDVTVHFGNGDVKDISIHVNSDAGDEPDTETLAGELSETETEAETEADNHRKVFEYEDSQVKVTATPQYPDAIPADAVLRVTEVTQGIDGYNYDAYMEALNNSAKGGESYDSSNTVLLDIAFIAKDKEGNEFEYQPEAGSVDIKIEFKNNKLSEEMNAHSEDDVTWTHLPVSEEAKAGADTTADMTDITANDISVEPLAADTSLSETDSVGFVVDSFSVYAGQVRNRDDLNIGISVKFYDKEGIETTSPATLGGRLYAYISTSDWGGGKAGSCRALIELEKNDDGVYSGEIDNLDFYNGNNGSFSLLNEQYKLYFFVSNEIYSVSTQNMIDSETLASNGDELLLGNGKYYRVELPSDMVSPGQDIEAEFQEFDNTITVDVNFKNTEGVTIQAPDSLDGKNLYAYVHDSNKQRGVVGILERSADQMSYSVVFDGTRYRDNNDLPDGTPSDSFLTNESYQVELFFTDSPYAGFDGKYHYIDQNHYSPLSDGMVVIDSYECDLPASTTVLKGQKYQATFGPISSDSVIEVDVRFEDEEGNEASAPVDFGGKHLYAYVHNNDRSYGVVGELEKSTDKTYSVVFYGFKYNNGELSSTLPFPDNETYTVELFFTDSDYQGYDGKYNRIEDNQYKPLQDGMNINDLYVCELPSSNLVSKGDNYTITLKSETPGSQFGPPGGDTFASVLGSAVNFGVVTEYFYLNTGDAQTNVAAYKGRCDTQTGNDITNNVEQTFILAEIENVFKIKGFKAYVMVPPEEADKVEENGINNSEHLTIDTSQSKAQLRAMIKGMLDYTRAQSLTLMGRTDNAEIEYNASNNSCVVDLTNRGSGTFYVTVDDEKYNQIMSRAEALTIIKSDNQTIVFNVTKSGTLNMQKFMIASDKDGATSGSDTFLNTQDSVPQTIIWNMPNADEVNITGSITGTVLAHNAEILVDATSSGWLIGAKVRIGSGEWHNVYQHIEKISGSTTLRAIKTISNELAAKSGFKFSLEYFDISTKEWKSGGNDQQNENSTIVFGGSAYPCLTFSDDNFIEVGKDNKEQPYAYYYYRMKETQGTIDSEGNQYEIDTSTYYARVKVTKVQVSTRATTTTVYSYRASEPEYFTDAGYTNQIDLNALPTFNNTPSGEKKVHVVKKWKGGIAEGLSGIRVQLYRNGEAVSGRILDLNASNNWMGDFENLEPSDNAGNSYTYTVVELNTNGVSVGDGEKITFAVNDDNNQYDVSIVEYPAGSFTITNSRPERITLSVQKQWKNGNNAYEDPNLPAVSVNVYQVKTPKEATGSQSIEKLEYTLTLNSGNSWMAQYPEQLLTEGKEDGVAYTYSYYVEEVPVTGFETSYSPYMPLEVTVGGVEKILYAVDNDGSITITNRPEKTDIPVSKQWQDNNNANGKRPESIKLQLMDGDKEFGDPVTIYPPEKDEDSDPYQNFWHYTFSNLPKYKYDADEKKWVLIKYSVVETLVEDSSEVYRQDKNEVIKDAQTGYITGIELINTEISGYALPATGGEGTRWIYLMSIMMIALAGAGFVMIRRRRELFR